MYCVIVVYRLHRFSSGLSYLLKVTKKNGHTSTGLLTAHLPAWKLVPALIQLMFAIGHDGAMSFSPTMTRDFVLRNFSLELTMLFFKM